VETVSPQNLNQTTSGLGVVPDLNLNLNPNLVRHEGGLLAAQLENVLRTSRSLCLPPKLNPPFCMEIFSTTVPQVAWRLLRELSS
jgi:hypothetical protein